MMRVHMTISGDNIDEIRYAMKYILKQGIPGYPHKHLVSRIDFAVPGEKNREDLDVDVVIYTG